MENGCHSAILSGINPRLHLTYSSHSSSRLAYRISWKFLETFSQTKNKQTNGRTDPGENITSLAKITVVGEIQKPSTVSVQRVQWQIFNWWLVHIFSVTYSRARRPSAAFRVSADLKPQLILPECGCLASDADSLHAGTPRVYERARDVGFETLAEVQFIVTDGSQR